MPMVIENIDAIARRRGRDVLYIIFHDDLRTPVDWANLPVRRSVIEWLDANGISWAPCGHVASTHFMVGYRGQIYVDVPFDTRHPVFQKLSAYLEHPDGSMAIPGVGFCYLPHCEAMKNAEHDAPGFWEQWAENF